MIDPIVTTVFGYSVTIGVLASVLTQVIKNTQSIPFLSNIPGVQKFIDAISPGNAAEVRIFVVAIAVIANIASVYYATGAVPALPIIIATVNSFLTALGNYDFMLKPKSDQ